MTGLWPEKKPTKFYLLRKYITWIISVAICLTMWLETLNSLTNLAKLSQILYVVATATVYVFKLFNLAYHEQQFIQLMDYLMTNNIFVSYPKELDCNLRKVVRFSNLVTKSFVALTVFAVFLYGLYPYFHNKELPIPFSYDVGDYFAVMYAFQMVGCYAIGLNNTTIDALTIDTISVACGHLDVLRERLVKNGRNQERELLNCVKHHNAIIK